MAYSSTGSSRSRSRSSTFCSHSSEMVAYLVHCVRSVLGLQVAIDEVDLLQTAKALADVLRTHVSDPLDSLKLGIGGGQDLVQPAELAHNRLDHQLRQARNAPKDPVAAWRHGVVKGVQLAVVAEQLGQAPEV